MAGILIITIIALLVTIVLIGRYLLSDLSRLWLKHSKSVFTGHEGVTYYCELFLVFLLTLALAVGAAALKGAAVTAVAMLTTGDLSEFTIALRGTYSFTNEAQLPGKHLVMLMVGPLLKLLATWTLMQSISEFFKGFNKRFGGEFFSESDSFFFSSIGVVLLMFIELLWHAQNVFFFNATANMLYLVFDKLYYLVCFLSVYLIRMLRTNGKQLYSAIGCYLKMSNVERKVILSPVWLLVISFAVGLVMEVPYFLGLQWITSNLALAAVFMVVLGVAYLILCKVFCRTWNYMGTVVFDTTMSGGFATTSKGMDNGKYSKIVRWALVIVVGGIVLLFGILHFKMLLLFVTIALLVALGVAVVGFLAYVIALLVGIVVKSVMRKDLGKMSSRRMLSYYGDAVISAIVASKWVFAAVFVAFMLVVCAPKTLDMDNVFANVSIVDTNGDVLYVDADHDRYYVPVSFEELPEFFRKALTLQEDRCFFEQKSALPNKSNWHGLSFTFFKNRGGSNINAQTVKNRSFLNASGFPRDISRKSADMLGGMMLSQRATPKEIMEDYVNMASFHGGRGYCGANAAALYAFGRPLGQLNKLELLYLVNTLPRSVRMGNGERTIAYTKVHEDSSQMVKGILLEKAESWLNEGRLSRKEFNELRHCDLGFTNQPFRSGITVPTRLRLEAETEGKIGRHLCFVTLCNESALARAYAQLQEKPAYRKNGSELQVASLVVDVHTGHVIGHYSSGVNDYTVYRKGFPIGSLGKPAIIIEMLSMGASPDMKLFDGQVKKRKTPKNANHDWSRRYVSISEMLSKSLNAPFVNICDVMNPRNVFLGVERSYQRMGIDSDETLCNDTYNYPLGNRLMTVEEMASLYQTIINDGLHVPLRVMEMDDTLHAERIYEPSHVAVVKEALSHTVTSGTMKAYRNQLPQGVTFYSKTGTSSFQKDGWNILSDGNMLIVTWASYGRLNGGHLSLGTEPLYGASTAGLFSVLAYNALNHTN